jgi:hypothetical protein
MQRYGQRFGLRRRLSELFLDALFVALLAHFFFTGHVVPPALVDLLRDNPQVVAVSPLEPGQHGPDSAPANNDSLDETPGT